MDFHVSQEDEKLHEKSEFGGKEQRKGSAMKAKVCSKWREKKRARERKKITLA